MSRTPITDYQFIRDYTKGSDRELDEWVKRLVISTTNIVIGKRTAYGPNKRQHYKIMLTHCDGGLRE